MESESGDGIIATIGDLHLDGGFWKSPLFRNINKSNEKRKKLASLLNELICYTVEEYPNSKIIGRGDYSRNIIRTGLGSLLVNAFYEEDTDKTHRICLLEGNHEGMAIPNDTKHLVKMLNEEIEQAPEDIEIMAHLLNQELRDDVLKSAFETICPFYNEIFPTQKNNSNLNFTMKESACIETSGNTNYVFTHSPTDIYGKIPMITKNYAKDDIRNVVFIVGHRHKMPYKLIVKNVKGNENVPNITQIVLPPYLAGVDRQDTSLLHANPSVYLVDTKNNEIRQVFYGENSQLHEDVIFKLKVGASIEDGPNAKRSKW